jgi:hypothetical protein
MSQNYDGKKIFLLYPHSVIRDDVLDFLIMAGYETYTLSDDKRARRIIAKFPDSIMFVNIDEGMKEKEWETYIKIIQEDPQTSRTRLGIMSYNQDRDLMQKYLMDLAVPCGSIQLKLGLQESTKILLKALEANEARGRRQCIRAACDDDINASVNFRMDKDVFRGKILDISSSGIAAKFDKSSEMHNGTVLNEVQLKLRGGLVMTKMIFMGLRRDDKRIFILLFDPKLPTEHKLTIHRYIKQCLQRFINGIRV